MKARPFKHAKLIFSIIVIQLFCISSSGAEAIIAEHNCVPQFEVIPATVINHVQDTYRLFYGHTSHGSQIVSGMSMLRDER